MRAAKGNAPTTMTVKCAPRFATILCLYKHETMRSAHPHNCTTKRAHTWLGKFAIPIPSVVLGAGAAILVDDDDDVEEGGMEGEEGETRESGLREELERVAVAAGGRRLRALSQCGARLQPCLALFTRDHSQAGLVPLQTNWQWKSARLAKESRGTTTISYYSSKEQMRACG